jgi:hypothetical protein
MERYTEQKAVSAGAFPKDSAVEIPLIRMTLATFGQGTNFRPSINLSF